MARQTAHPEKSALLEWLWLLVTAPGRVVTLDSPYPPDEVKRRLRTQKDVAKVLSPTEVSIRLSVRSNARRFMATVEPGDAGQGTRIVGQMQTPYMVAALRVSAGLFLLGMAIIWLQASKIWLGVIFALVGIGFLFLSQYERLIAQDLRLHQDWLKRVLDAKPAKPATPRR